MILSLTHKVLEFIKSGSVNTSDIITAFALCGRSISDARMRFKLREIRKDRESFIAEQDSRQKFYKLLSKLKTDGFIAKSAENWVLTKAGEDKFQKFEDKYIERAGRTLKIVAFDIPEKKSCDRKWIRSVLKNLGFRILQKSLWLGRVHIPERFVKDLRDRDIIDCVHIFEISRTGSLSEVV